VRGTDLHRLRRIRGQPGDRQTVLEEAADALDATRSPPALAGPQQMLNDKLHASFEKWYPGFGAQDHAPLAA
jgi:hypothetical protein